jgi:hypothetical protein
VKKFFFFISSLSSKHLVLVQTVVAAVRILADFQGSIYLALLIPKYAMVFDECLNDENMQN